jgi:hypothetical protein
MPDDKIRPGIPTPSFARKIMELQRQAAENARALQKIQKPHNPTFPAVLTARTFDSATGWSAYDWTEQQFSTNGLRETKPGGRTGTSTWQPAVSYGDGTVLGTSDLPKEVWLRERAHSATRGLVHEFPWYCACVAGRSGSGSGGGNFSECCPDVALPNTLFATFMAPGCPCLDGLVVPVPLDNPSPAEWAITTSICGVPWRITIFGFIGCQVVAAPIEAASNCSASGFAFGPVICDPFSATATATLNNAPFGFPDCPCDSISYEVIVTA